MKEYFVERLFLRGMMVYRNFKYVFMYIGLKRTFLTWLGHVNVCIVLGFGSPSCSLKFHSDLNGIFPLFHACFPHQPHHLKRISHPFFHDPYISLSFSNTPSFIVELGFHVTFQSIS